MANKDNLIKLVAEKLGPDKLNQIVQQTAQEFGQDPDITPDVINKIIQMFEFVAENPEEYQSVIQQAIQSGALDEGDAPPEFDPAFVAIVLLALYGLRDSMGAQQAPSQMAQPQMEMPQMAMGGLHSMAQKLQNAGRGTDTILAHITPQEADLLERRGGAGSINPATGLPEYKFKLKKALKKVAKIAKTVAPMVVGALTLNPYLAAATGAALNAKQGLKGMAIGALSGYMATPGNALAQNIGKYALQIPGVSSLGLSPEVLGSSVLGAGSAAIQGRNPITGALLSGAVANYAPGLVDKYGSALPDGMAQSIATGAQMGASTGSGVKGTLAGGASGALTNLAMSGLSNVGVEPNTTTPTAPLNPENTMYDAATNSFTSAPDVAYGPNGEYFGQPLDVASNTGGYAPTISDAGLSVGPPAAAAPTGALSQMAQTTTTAPSTGFGFGDIAKVGLIGSLIAGKTPQQANDAIMQDPALTAQQKEGMLRSLTNYTFSPNTTTFPMQGTPEYTKLMADLSQGKEQTYMAPTLEVKAKGGRTNRRPQGALSQVSRLSLGAGDGRSDSIEARLSDGEYVIDAETVALLGNGSTKAGAAMLDQMRQGIRQQKGKALAKGKFSPNAKAPLAYMKGGLR